MSRKDNKIADVLSCVAMAMIPATVGFSRISGAQKDKAVFQSVRTNSKYKLREFPILRSTYSIYC